jgi:ketosteroid isomerase-like protein
MLRTWPIFLVLLITVAAAPHVPRDELQNMLDEQTAAWNRGDLPGFMRGYWNSPDVTFFSGDTIIQGWEPTLERYRKKYQIDGKQMGHLHFTDQNIDMLSAGAAVYTARWHLAMPDGSKLEGLTTVLCKRMKDGWKIVHDHSS